MASLALQLIGLDESIKESISHTRVKPLPKMLQTAQVRAGAVVIRYLQLLADVLA